MLLSCIIATIMLTSLFLGNQVLSNYVYREAEKRNEAVFQQMTDELDQFGESINSIFRKTAYNKQLVNMIRNGSNYQTLQENKSWFQSFSEDNHSIIPQLRHSMLYSKDGKLLVSKGDYFIDVGEIGGEEQYPVISHIMDREKYPVFYVRLPIMEKLNYSVSSVLGYLVLLLDAEGVQDIVNNGALFEESKVTVYHQDGKPMVMSSLPINADDRKKADQIILSHKLPISDFEVISIVPRNKLARGSNMIRTVMNWTFAIIFLLISVVFLIFYGFFIKPIRKQIEFMENYTNNDNHRIEVIGTNEVGEMADKMNQMLDDIDLLNQDIVAKEKAYYLMETRKNKTKMVALRSQVSPHFLYNTFSCIRGIALLCFARPFYTILQRKSTHLCA